MTTSKGLDRVCLSVSECVLVPRFVLYNCDWSQRIETKIDNRLKYYYYLKKDKQM